MAEAAAAASGERAGAGALAGPNDGARAERRRSATRSADSLLGGGEGDTGGDTGGCSAAEAVRFRGRRRIDAGPDPPTDEGISGMDRRFRASELPEGGASKKSGNRFVLAALGIKSGSEMDCLDDPGPDPCMGERAAKLLLRGSVDVVSSNSAAGFPDTEPETEPKPEIEPEPAPSGHTPHDSSWLLDCQASAKLTKKMTSVTPILTPRKLSE